ncbi:hypothetical protein EON81_22475 [bacterium]|nr:MAG: hypothetical protein EON81_22475 [bacterium]
MNKIPRNGELWTYGAGVVKIAKADQSRTTFTKAEGKAKPFRCNTAWFLANCNVVPQASLTV